MDITLRKPKKTTPDDKRQMKLPFVGEFIPGWSGRRYLLCVDDRWHLVTRVYDGLVVDTACAEDTKLASQEENSRKPMCDICAAVHARQSSRQHR